MATHPKKQTNSRETNDSGYTGRQAGQTDPRSKTKLQVTEELMKIICVNTHTDVDGVLAADNEDTLVQRTGHRRYTE